MLNLTPIRLRVAELRRARGLTQTELAENADIRRATLIDIEKGRTTGIDFKVLDRIAVALGVDAAMLVEHTTKGNR